MSNESKEENWCPQCHLFNMHADARYCPSCGSRLIVKPAPRICSGCGNTLAENDRFCEMCGLKKKF